MSKIIFNEIQMKQLEKDKNVVKASERSITADGDKAYSVMTSELK